MSTARLLRLSPRQLLTPTTSSKLFPTVVRCQSTFQPLRIARARFPTPPHLKRAMSSVPKEGESSVEAPAAASEPSSTNEAKDSKQDEALKDKEIEKLKEEKDDLIGRLRYLQADLMNAQRIAKVEKEKMKDYAIVKFAGDLLQTVDTLEMALKSAKQHGVDIDEMSSETSSGTSSGTSSSSSDDEEGVPTKDTPTSTTTSSSNSSAASSSSSSNEAAPTASTSPSSSSPDSALLHGIHLTHRHLLQTLSSYHIHPFTPTGQTFDPNWHEALFEVPLAVAESLPDLKTKVPDGEIKPGVIVDTYKSGYRIKERCLRAAQVGVVGEH